LQDPALYDGSVVGSWKARFDADELKRAEAAKAAAGTAKDKIMLADRDRIFTNLYGYHGADLQSALKRGNWDGTKIFIDKGRDWIVNEMA